MKGVILGSIAAAILAATGVQAGTAASGIGVSLCGDVYDAYSSASASGRDALVTAVGQWAFGYMTGKNSGLPQGSWKDVGAVGADTTGALIIDQCGDYPTLRVGEIVDVIYDALPSLNGSS